MTAALMPEKYTAPLKRYISAMQIGEVGWIDFTNVRVNPRTKRTYVDMSARLLEPSSSMRVRIQRLENGYGISFPHDKGFTFLDMIPWVLRLTTSFAPVTKIEITDPVELKS